MLLASQTWENETADLAGESLFEEVFDPDGSELDPVAGAGGHDVASGCTASTGCTSCQTSSYAGF